MLWTKDSVDSVVDLGYMQIQSFKFSFSVLERMLLSVTNTLHLEIFVSVYFCKIGTKCYKFIIVSKFWESLFCS